MPNQPDEKVTLRTWIAVMGSMLGAFMRAAAKKSGKSGGLRIG